MRSYYSVYLMYTSFNWSLVSCRLAQQLKSIVDQCESRESVGFTFCRWSALSLLNIGPLRTPSPSFMQTFDKILQQKQLELQLAEVKLAQSRVAAAQEKETHETEKQLVSISLTEQGPSILLAVAHSPLVHLCFFLFTHPPHASPLVSPFLPSSPFPTYIHIRVSHSFTVFTVFQCLIWSLLCGFINLSSPTCSHATTVDGATSRAPEKM